MRHHVFAIVAVRAWAELLGDWMRGIPGFEMAGTAADAATALVELARIDSPVDIVMIEVSTRLALESVAALRRADPPRKLIAVALDDDPGEAMAWASVGAAGLLGRNASAEQLGHALVNVARGAVHCSDEISGALLRGIGANGGRSAADAHNGLTDREQEVARLLAHGLTNKEIADHLHISPGTVKSHVHNVICKLGVRRRAYVARKLGHAGAAVRVRESAPAGHTGAAEAGWCSTGAAGEGQLTRHLS
ncbi:response regulator transcription factor [Mycobacterium sp. TNTM28]|uniref:Response regulator transcription factor n=1 Tax=[Mycobacterium] fortunisiensis TaxID=2600579 RepID=A0ABS6KPG7_9MYCO|nr:response regulator transcription factor [[Mycobacterium] fortunisiensis]MBU9765513.1 response regulator transcription factor [[Mycobacterium] fortunisiensis]